MQSIFFYKKFWQRYNLIPNKTVGVVIQSVDEESHNFTWGKEMAIQNIKKKLNRVNGCVRKQWS